MAVPGETNNFAVSFVGQLDSGESLSGTPTVEEQDTSDLTITSKKVSTSALTINDQSVAAGKAVQFTVRGQLVANTPYTIKITVTTDGSPNQTKIGFVKFSVANE